MSSVHDLGSVAWLSGSGARVFFSDSTGFMDDTRDKKVAVNPVNAKSKSVDFVPWGDNNKMPLEVLQKMHANVTVASNADFNARIAYGDSILVVKKTKADGKIVLEELTDSEQPEIFDFLENNNMLRIFQECGNDMVAFGDAFVELIFDNNNPARVVKIRQKEAAFSRLSVMDEKLARVLYHGYSAKWGDGSPDDVVITPFLDRDAPLYDLKMRLGILPNEKNGKLEISKDKRFVLSLGLPTPGRFYYNKPYWWSIFASGWYDFSQSLPKLKKALMENEMIIKYEININEKFWDKLYKSEGLVSDEDKVARRKLFLQEMDDFLSNRENAGKSFVKHFKYDQQKGYEEHDILIKPVESTLKGGEYIEDSEEVSNIICYAMGVHPSLQGASPGKGKTINGTEARELFIIKQAMTKPLRDALLLPLYIVKSINKWDKDIHFVIPNIMLTTLDKNTGAEKQIGNQNI